MKTLKKYGVWGGLVITLVLVYAVGPQENEEGVFLSKHAEKNNKKEPNQKEVGITNNAGFLLRKMIVDEPANLFAVTYNAQVEQMYEEIPRELDLPTNPFSYAGKLIENGEVIVFLTDGRKNYVVKTGDSLEGTWKVKFIHPPEMALLYLPLKKVVSIQIGAPF